MTAADQVPRDQVVAVVQQLKARLDAAIAGSYWGRDIAELCDLAEQLGAAADRAKGDRMAAEPDPDDVRCGYEQIRPCADGEAVSTLEVRSDLYVDLDADRQVLGVERIGDDVRYDDLCDVIKVLVARRKEDG